MKDIISNLNKAFENRVRLGIMSILMVDSDVSFNRLKELLGVTDGNLASHLKSLEKLKYIEVFKSFVDRKPNTVYNATEQGRSAFESHLSFLEKMLNK